MQPERVAAAGDHAAAPPKHTHIWPATPAPASRPRPLQLYPPEFRLTEARRLAPWDRMTGRSMKFSSSCSFPGHGKLTRGGASCPMGSCRSACLALLLSWTNYPTLRDETQRRQLDPTHEPLLRAASALLPTLGVARGMIASTATSPRPSAGWEQDLPRSHGGYPLGVYSIPPLDGASRCWTIRCSEPLPDGSLMVVKLPDQGGK